MPTFFPCVFVGYVCLAFVGGEVIGLVFFFQFLVGEINYTLEEVCSTVVKTIRKTPYELLQNLLFIVVLLYCNNSIQALERFPTWCNCSCVVEYWYLVVWHSAPTGAKVGEDINYACIQLIPCWFLILCSSTRGIQTNFSLYSFRQLHRLHLEADLQGEKDEAFHWISRFVLRKL